MTMLRTLYWFAIWLLSPTRNAVLLKCVLIGVVLKVLSLVLVIPALLFTQGVFDPAGPTSPDHDLYATNVGNVSAIVFSPLVETAAMALVFGLLGVLPRYSFVPPRVVPSVVIVIGAVFLHHHDLFTSLFVVFMFSAFCTQYTLFRAHFTASTTILGVATTHATVNAFGILIGRALLT